MDHCVFCRIIAGKQPADVIAQTERVIVFLSLENHPLIVPKAHVEHIYGLDDALAADLMRATVRVSRALKAGLGCDGVAVTQRNEPAAGQDVFHLHIHVIPRWHGDRSIWPEQAERDPAARRERRDRIAAALEPLGA